MRNPKLNKSTELEVLKRIIPIVYFYIPILLWMCLYYLLNNSFNGLDGRQRFYIYLAIYIGINFFSTLYFMRMKNAMLGWRKFIQDLKELFLSELKKGNKAFFFKQLILSAVILIIFLIISLGMLFVVSQLDFDWVCGIFCSKDIFETRVLLFIAIQGGVYAMVFYGCMFFQLIKLLPSFVRK